MQKDTRFFVSGSFLALLLVSFTVLQKEAKWKSLAPVIEPEVRCENAFVCG